jgi:hypothetical protein
VLLALVFAGCVAPIEGGRAEERFTVGVEPDGTLEAAPPIVRLRVSPAADDLYLVAGELGSAHLGQLARGEPSNALAERFVPAARWREGDELVIAPLTALAPGPYAIARASTRQVTTLVVGDDDAVPLLEAVWPPEGIGRQAWWCGAELPPFTLTARLGEGVDVEVERREGCAVLRLPAGLEPDVVLAPPPAITAGGAVLARIEPVALSVAAEVPAIEPLACAEGTVAVGPACARVFDDRLELAVPEAPLLWVLATTGQIEPRARGGSVWVHPLLPSSAVSLVWSAIDLAGETLSGSVLIETRAPMAHLVLNEVLANPIGPEPAQEWIELYNDGVAAAELAGYVLEDLGGETTLPAARVEPGGHVLVVNAEYDAAFEYDVPPVRGALVVRVEQLGKGGLNNQGEPLKLVAADGSVVSRFPMLPKPKSGLSIGRRWPRAADDDPEAFAVQTPTPGAGNLDEPVP